jgi:putative peptide zinc metalloprotease protein
VLVKVPNLRLTRRAPTAVAAVAVLVVGLAGWALADGDVPLLSSSSSSAPTTIAASVGGSGSDNVAVATNTKDGKTVVAVSLKIVQVKSDTVDAGNAAVAAASCNDCETVAIALEGVLVAGDPSTFDPTNIALALNTDCTNCQTLAAAYQEVVQNGTKVRISGEGRKAIAEIRKDLESLRNSGLDIFAIRQRVNEDAGKLLAVLQNDVFPIGQGQKADAATSTPTAPSSTAPPSSAPPSTDAPATTAAPSTTAPPATTVPPTTSTTAAP